jgi:signal transduction histidine kinase
VTNTEIETRKRFRLFLCVHPLQALVEAWVVAFLVLFLLSCVVGRVQATVFFNGTLLICGLAGIWVTLRARIPDHPIWLQVLWELGVGAVLSLSLAVGLQVVSEWLGWTGVWNTAIVDRSVVTILLGLTGVGYLVARVGVRVWLFWNRLRKRRMVFALTHALLTLPVIAVAVFVLGMTAVTVLTGQLGAPIPESSGWFPLVADRFFLTVMPVLGISVVMISLALIVLIAPAAVFSYVVARRTTRRLGVLAQKARAMSDGEYSARVEVSGEDEVAQLQRDFNAMAAQLQGTLGDLARERDTVSSLEAERRKLVASVSHELRTPVATVRAMLESVLERDDDVLPDSLRADMETMDGEVKRLQSLIDDLFTLSRAEVGQLDLVCEPVDVGPVVQHAVDAMAPLAWRSDRVQVVADLPDDLPSALVDRSRLEQVLANLLRNGVRHTQPGGIVAVMAEAEQEAIRLEVRDTGEGIAPEDLSHVWDRFYRGESARKQDSRGAGLGLSLVRELVKAMGGSVSAASVLGEGSTFTVRLPRARDTD